MFRLLLVLSLLTLTACRQSDDSLDGGSCGTAIPNDAIQEVPTSAPSAMLAGELEILAIDGAAEGEAFEYYVKESRGARHRLRLGSGLENLSSGDRVRVRGTRLPLSTRGQMGKLPTLQVEAGDLEVSPRAAVLPRTFGAQKLAVILLGFSDKAPSNTRQQAQDLVFDQVNRFMLENSYGQTSLTGDVFGPFTLGLSSAACEPYAISSAARSALQASGASLSGYTRIMYVFPKNGCSWYGLGTVGGNPSEAWINGSLVLHTVAHELGHNFGLYHAHALDCSGSTCSSLEYGDAVDVMGNRQPGHFSSFMKERLGWLGYGSSPGLEEVSLSGTYRIEPYASSPAGLPKALKVEKNRAPATGQRDFYYLEYRHGVGFDSIFDRISSQNLTDGLTVHTGSESGGNTQYLLHMNPGLSWYRSALEVTKSLVDAATGMVVTLASRGPEAAEVQVSFPIDPVCQRRAPEWKLVSAQPFWVPAGIPVDYELTLTNLDSAACDPSGFDLSADEVSGLTGSWSQNRLILGPGQRGSARLTLTSLTSLPPNAYPVSLRADRMSGPNALAVTAWYLRQKEEGVSVAGIPDRSRVGPGQQVQIRILVEEEGHPAGGKRTFATVSAPSGKSISLSGWTDAQGTSTHTLKLSPCAGRGTYLIRAGIGETEVLETFFEVQ